ncbi:hypothetical protein [Chitinophaga sp. Cy-1792]|uniref:hypothetical protein n=1 Tax=Chitinophaga sp. Cy-1792 TaxID=2608339 RepID=UPI00141FADF2|nr:hypothetical protein [Chitinophaga sp. Cy-1792]NIG52978.1 hypothetical protein [Chitinophaga sp. Cy-1792]
MKRSALVYCCFGAWIIFSACAKKSDDQSTVTPPVDPPAAQDTTPKAKYDITLLASSNAFLTTPEVHAMARQDYNELSGIAASQLNKGILYVHDDYNGNRTVVITNANGDDLGQIILDNVSTRNMEDIAVGPGPVAGKTYIYVGDIGDNNAARTSVAVYRFEEPIINNADATTKIHITAVDKLEFVYPKTAVNAETLLVDPLTKDIYIATKQSTKSILYKAPYPQSSTGPNPLFSVLTTNFDLLTSGDISPDGTEIMLRSKGQIWYWKRGATQTVVQALLVAPETVPYAGNEHQGEGVGFAADGSGYYTDTEVRDYPGAISNISFYKRK